ncbi:MAG: DUF6434 domain-containing protein [Burkholderiaceae bacterium]
MVKHRHAAARRPALTTALSVQAFRRWYWLKEELVAFCRKHSLPVSGSKLEVAERVGHYLRHREVLRPQARKNRRGAMPNVFTLKTVIGEGWRCNPALGAFFREHCGRGFRFNASMRAFIHEGAGLTLAEAIVCYEASIKRPKTPRPIAPSLEYNQHTREFFKQNPGATRQQAIEAWWAKRRLPKTND